MARVALLSDGKSVTKYLVVKDARNEWVDSAHLKFAPTATLAIDVNMRGQHTDGAAPR